MAVITKFFIVRNGVELDKVFEDKKMAEAYDKMLDAAENLAAFIKHSDLQVDIDAKTVDEISIYLAKNAPEVTRILKGLKPITPPVPEASKIDKPPVTKPTKVKKSPGKKSKTSPTKK
ncbi:MAG: YebG family protein [Deltaproteobacteria bacterium]|nr:YebG family protein [Deltaproteobacteria bacterium]